MKTLSINLPDETRAKLQIAEHFIAIHLQSHEGLEQLGILRTKRLLQADYSEWLVSQLLDIQLLDNPVAKGFDGTDSQGQKYQIKGRVVQALGDNTSFDFKTLRSKFDFLAGVLLSPSFQLLGLIRVDYDTVKKLANKNRGRYSFRLNQQALDDPRLERLFWNETGFEIK
ncbi:MAG: hypothetical protein CL914_15835 [Deltaproteobacteria bacterium]|nr:hypothetical protein [Deltaproteobacteria bacterium]|tara:strand:- start:50 stop:559 length:510 start_codon:yes stop_codon:yes gene_type:complete